MPKSGAHLGNAGLVDFFDVDRIADSAAKVLDAPADYKPLGQSGVRMIQERYSLDVCLPRMLALYEEAFHGYRETNEKSK